MNSLKKGNGVQLLNFEGGPGVPLLNFGGGDPKVWDPRSRGPDPTFAPIFILQETKNSNLFHKKLFDWDES